MAVNSLGLHHWQKRRRTNENHKKIKKFFDKVMYLIAVLVPIAHIPQLVKIWYLKDASGISLISWTSFIVFSLFWLIYGILHKEKPIILMYFFLLLIQISIVYGGFLYG